MRGYLLRGSFFMILSSIVSSALGFFFWMAIAKLYIPKEVGVASTLISSISLFLYISRFGLDSSLIRFFPENNNNKDKIFSTCLIITTLIGIVLGFVLIFILQLTSNEFNFLKSPLNVFIFIIVLLACSISSIISISFIALRKSSYYFIQTSITGSKILFAFLTQPLGILGIFGAVGLSFILSILISLNLIKKCNLKFCPSIDYTFIKESFNFSITNYISDLFIFVPSQILPIMVLNLLGAEICARYYIAFAIASVLFIIPSSVSTSLFVEGSNGEELHRTTLKSIFISIFLLIIPILILFIFGISILEFIGATYAEGYDLIKYLAISSLFYSLFQNYLAIKKVKKDTKDLVYLGILFSLLMLSLNYVFMEKFNLIGIGYAWLITCAACSIIVLCFSVFKREHIFYNTSRING